MLQFEISLTELIPGYVYIKNTTFDDLTQPTMYSQCGIRIFWVLHIFSSTCVNASITFLDICNLETTLTLHWEATPENFALHYIIMKIVALYYLLYYYNIV